MKAARLWLACALSVAATGCGAYSLVGQGQASTDPIPPAGVGASWTAVPVAFGPSSPTTPSLLRLQDGTWLLAYGSDQLGSHHLYVVRSADGKSWSAPQGAAAAGLSDQDPALLQDAAGTVHLIFSSNRDGLDWRLYETALQGATWTPPQPLGLPGAMQQSPSVARTPQGWALAYQSGDGMVVAQSADGVSWSPEGEVVPLLDAPAIAQIGANLVVVGERANQLIEVERGATGKWTAPGAIAIGGEARQPALATDASGSAILAFASRPSDGAAWQLATSSWTGTSWSAPTSVASGDYNIVSPSVELGTDGRACIAWGITQADDSQGLFFAARAAQPSPQPAPVVRPKDAGGGGVPQGST